MRITRLHILLIAIIIFCLAVFVFQVHETRRLQKEQVVVDAKKDVQVHKAKFEEQKKQTEEQKKQNIEQKKQLGIEAVAVAGEYWKIAKSQGRDYTIGQATLRKAKKSLKQQDFESAWKLARQSIKELKAAPQRKKGKKYYIVRRGDSLWRIAKMPQHYRKGSMWVKIWRANKKKIPNFSLIYPRQKFLIP